MIVNMNKNKKLIISHIADVDGVSAVILAKLHYEDIDYCLVEFSELESLLERINNEGLYKNYDTIFITDLSIRTRGLEIIEENEELKGKIRHFDHHITELGQKGQYSFVNVENEKDGKLVCGTTMFYDYIKDDFKYKNAYLDKFLEAVRSYDTEGPLCGNKYANDLTTLFSLIGIDNFIKKFGQGIKEGKDPLTEEDENLLHLEEERMNEYIDLCDKNLVRINLNGHQVGVSISELYRSSVGNLLSLRHQDLDYILIINFMRNQFSFRTVKDNIHVGNIAKSLTPNGGGHEKAAGMPLNNDTLFILDLVKDGLREKEQIKIKNKDSN